LKTVENWQNMSMELKCLPAVPFPVSFISYIITTIVL
jgi:hypothetical protein